MRSKSAHRQPPRNKLRARRSRTAGRNNPRAGFTLIETLAALAIAAAVFAVIAEFAGRTLRNWNYGDGVIASMEMITRGLGRLGTDLSLALPMTPPGGDGSSVYFMGDASKMLFVASTGFGIGDRGLELLNITASGEGDNFYLTRQRSPVSNPPGQFRDSVVLLHGRMQVRFLYLDQTGKAFESWTNKAVMPSAVAVQVDVPQRGPLFPRPLLLPIPVNYSADCLAGGEDDGEEKPARCSPEEQGQQPQQPQPGQPGRRQGAQR